MIWDGSLDCGWGEEVMGKPDGTVCGGCFGGGLLLL